MDFKNPNCDRCDGGVHVQRISALDDPRGFIDKPVVCPCVAWGNRREAARVLIGAK